VKKTLTSQNRSRLLRERARLLDLTTDAILVRDAADRITFWNRGASEMYGFRREEADGRVSHDLLRTEFPEPLHVIKEKFARDGHWAGELRHTCANGSRITVSTRWVAERDTRGNIASILESNRDISESKQAQEAQSRLAAIVESSEDAIVSKDLDGIIINWNKAAERIFGYAAEEAIGQHITLIVPPDRLNEEADILASLRRGERIDHFETVRKRKDGTLFDISVTISPVKDAQGRVIGASKVARDVTERKRLALLLQEAELSGRLLQLQDEERRRIARELHDGAGQLLAALSMNISAISTEESRLSLGVARNVEESRSLIDQAVSEIRTISYLLHPPLLDEVGLISALNEYVNGFGERSNIRVRLDLPSDLERLPRDVELSIFRIVQECLTNVHRHSGSATATVHLSRGPGEIQLQVSDQGQGINREIQDKFLTGKSSGVGLRGMRERIRQLGGRMQIQSSGNGTSVIVVLPILAKEIAGDERKTRTASPSQKAS
jgi:PAS domain S-box-containing protein